MPYASKMSPSAKRQLKVCFNCYNQHDEMMIWLKGLVSKAEQGYSDRVSLDLNEWFEGLPKVPIPSEEDLDAGNWSATWKFFVKSGTLGKIATLVEMLKGRVPIQLWYTTQVFSYLTGAIIEEVAVYYEVNHVTKLVTFRHFANLPGGDLPDI